MPRRKALFDYSPLTVGIHQPPLDSHRTPSVGRWQPPVNRLGSPDRHNELRKKERSALVSTQTRDTCCCLCAPSCGSAAAEAVPQRGKHVGTARHTKNDVQHSVAPPFVQRRAKCSKSAARRGACLCASPCLRKGVGRHTRMGTYARTHGRTHAERKEECHRYAGCCWWAS